MFKRVLLAIVVILIGWTLYEWISFPDVDGLAKEPPATTSFMEIRRQELKAEGKDDTIHYTWVPYGRISPYLRRAALVAEDDTFYEHGGVDVKAMQDALKKDWAKKKVAEGGSTITQQLAKNLYLSSSRNPFRKLKEYLIARSLENHLTKKRILELYLNVVEMGERVYGAEAAARYYFNESASALTPSQAALLAGCLPNPRIMTPDHPNKRLRSRQAMILSRMRRWGFLVEQEVLAPVQPKAAATPPPTDTDLTPAPLDTNPPTVTDTTPPPANDTNPPLSSTTT